jgi:hypothetical protein
MVHRAPKRVVAFDDRTSRSAKQAPRELIAHIGGRDQRHDIGNDQRPWQRPGPNADSDERMRPPMELILSIVVLVLLFGGGGGYFGRSRGYW